MDQGLRFQRHNHCRKRPALHAGAVERQQQHRQQWRQLRRRSPQRLIQPGVIQPDAAGVVQCQCLCRSAPVHVGQRRTQYSARAGPGHRRSFPAAHFCTGRKDASDRRSAIVQHPQPSQLQFAGRFRRPTSDLRKNLFGQRSKTNPIRPPARLLGGADFRSPLATYTKRRVRFEWNAPKSPWRRGIRLNQSRRATLPTFRRGLSSPFSRSSAWLSVPAPHSMRAPAAS